MKLQKIKNGYYKLKCNIRYKEFKQCSIPYPFYNKKKNTFEWIMYNNKTAEYEINNNLQYALENNTNSGLTYHYKAKIYGREKSNQEMKYRMMTGHCHSFDEIIKELYYYPETFEIPKEYLYEYSEQELKFLKQLKNYLNLIELKDYRIIEEKTKLEKDYKKKHKLTIFYYNKKIKKLINKENIIRYENSKAKEYAMMKPMYFKDINIAKEIINGNIDYIIDVQYSFSPSKLNEKWLIIADNTYFGIVEVIKEDIIKFKNLQENMLNYNLAGFKDFNDYKKELFKKLKNDSLSYKEHFTEESLIKYLKLKVIRKLTI